MIITDLFTKSDDSDCHKKGIKAGHRKCEKSPGLTLCDYLYFCIIVQSKKKKKKKVTRTMGEYKCVSVRGV